MKDDPIDWESKAKELERENLLLKKGFGVQGKGIAWLAAIGGLSILGISLTQSLHKLLKKLKDEPNHFPDWETAVVLSAFIRRFWLGGLLAGTLALIPLCALVWQNFLIEKQNQHFQTQLQLLQQESNAESERNYVARRTELIRYLYGSKIVEVEENGKKNNKKISLYDARLRSDAVKEFLQLEISNDKKVNLTKALLADTNLSGISLQGVDLREVDFEGANLEGANLKGADIRKANLQECRLRFAILRDANLSGANLFKADLSNVDITNTTFGGGYEGSLNWFTGRPMPSKYKDFKELVNLENALLRGIDFSGVNLNFVNLKKSNLEGANFEGARLDGANFEEAVLEYANFTRASAKGASFSNANLGNTIFKESTLYRTNFEKSNLSGANFESASLEKANFVNAELQSANLINANLKDSNLAHASLRDADLSQANLSGAKVVDYFNGMTADFRGSILKEASFERTRILYNYERQQIVAIPTEINSKILNPADRPVHISPPIPKLQDPFEFLAYAYKQGAILSKKDLIKMRALEDRGVNEILDHSHPIGFGP